MGCPRGPVLMSIVLEFVIPLLSNSLLRFFIIIIIIIIIIITICLLVVAIKFYVVVSFKLYKYLGSNVMNI